MTAPYIVWDFMSEKKCVKCGVVTFRFVNGTPIHRSCEEGEK